MRLIVVATAAGFTLSGCVTSFNGSAKLEGPVECVKRCDGWGMDLAGMVAMGDYTNGCICKIKGQHISLEETGKAAVLAASPAGSVAGSSEKMKEERGYQLLKHVMSELSESAMR